MPKAMELKEIDGELWARVGKPGEFPSGVAMWTPEECKAFAEEQQKIALETIDEIKDFTSILSHKNALWMKIPLPIKN